MIKKIRFAVLLLLSVFLLCSCNSLVKLTYEDGRYTGGGVSYVGTPVSFQAAAVGEPYAVYTTHEGKASVTLYEIDGLDPKRWLTEYEGGVSAVYCSEAITLPALSGFNPDSILICAEDELVMHIATVDNASVIRRVLDVLASGEPLDMPLAGAASYHLKFTSPDYPGLYYDILYIIDRDGAAYFYDRSTKIAVAAGSALTGYIDSYDDTDPDAANGE